MENRGQVPDNWFIDPLLLGVSGAYTDFEQDPLSWQADALCAQTDPEAFFPEKGGSTRDAKEFAPVVTLRHSASSMHLLTMKDLVFGAGFLREKDAN